MAETFGVEEAIERIFSKEYDVMVEESEEEQESNTAIGSREEIRKCLNSFQGSTGFDKEMFTSVGEKVLLPLINLCKSEPNTIEKVLQTTSINAACLLQHDSQLWLAAIHRWLAGRRSVRHPYYAEIHRDIPVDLFTALSHSITVTKDPKLGEPMCYIKGNSKGKVVSLTDIKSVIYLLTLLSGKLQEEVTFYLKRTLGGARKNHKTKVLVSQEKDFGLIYCYNKGQLTISFNYGEWNSFGFPQHNCTFTDDFTMVDFTIIFLL